MSERHRIPEHRIAGFKNRNAMKQDELRRRREDTAIEIRKQKREESLAKRRNLKVPADSESEDEVEIMGLDPSITEQLPAMIEKVNCADPERQLEATTWFRKLLSKGGSPRRTYRTQPSD